MNLGSICQNLVDPLQMQQKAAVSCLASGRTALEARPSAGPAARLTRQSSGALICPNHDLRPPASSVEESPAVTLGLEIHPSKASPLVRIDMNLLSELLSGCPMGDRSVSSSIRLACVGLQLTLGLGLAETRHPGCLGNREVLRVRCHVCALRASAFGILAR